MKYKSIEKFDSSVSLFARADSTGSPGTLKNNIL
jgi:hypothetical protein